MSVPIRIDKDIYEMAKAVAKSECRTIPAQIEYWVRLGKETAEKRSNPKLDKVYNSFGAWKDRNDISDSVDYVNDLRSSLDRKL